MNRFNQVRNSILGFVLGDAVGVPYEFKSKTQMATYPAIDMIGNGTHHQPIGTWSDDSSMMFILMEWLIDLKNSGKNLLQIDYVDYSDLKSVWLKFYKSGHWTPHEECFDIGSQTRRALLEGTNYGPIAMNVDAQGNGALMRILPFGFLDKNDPEFRYALRTVMIKTCELTHGSVISNYYCEELLENIHMAFRSRSVPNLLLGEPNSDNGWTPETYKTVMASLRLFPSKYFKHELPDFFKSIILTAINYGEDTDTVAAITGGLMGCTFDTKDALPSDWLSKIVKINEIEDLIVRFYDAYKGEIDDN